MSYRKELLAVVRDTLRASEAASTDISGAVYKLSDCLERLDREPRTDNRTQLLNRFAYAVLSRLGAEELNLSHLQSSEEVPSPQQQVLWDRALSALQNGMFGEAPKEATVSPIIAANRLAGTVLDRPGVRDSHQPQPGAWKEAQQDLERWLAVCDFDCPAAELPEALVKTVNNQRIELKRLSELVEKLRHTLREKQQQESKIWSEGFNSGTITAHKHLKVELQDLLNRFADK